MISVQEILARLVLAAILSAIVGLERERKNRAAGLRTHAMVGMASALVMIVSAFGFSDILGRQAVVLDPSRVAAQVVSGIGFLGAGVIIFRRNEARGLTTAASIWTVAAIGLATGGGLYVAALFTTALALGILAVLKPLERHLFAVPRTTRVSMVIDRHDASVGAIASALEGAGVAVQRLSIQPRVAPSHDRLTVVLAQGKPEALHAAIEALRATAGVEAIDVRGAPPLG
ncbi:MAG TPA: MgtC/SapB family protein [Gemmatimonadaceae bacterium]|nr:MgtC/SapB family protein [Gemmatimonadaceae bacterium]